MAAIQRKPIPSPAAQDAETAGPISPQVPSAENLAGTGPATPLVEKAGKAKVSRNRVGKPVQFWLHEEDRKIIRELAAWLAGQGIRPTDSMVVRTALSMAKTGSGLLDCYRKAALLDGRLRPK
jgi:hypothetical protein